MRNIIMMVFLSAMILVPPKSAHSAVPPTDLDGSYSIIKNMIYEKGLDYSVEVIEDHGMQLATITTIQHSDCKSQSILRRRDKSLFTCYSVFADVLNGPLQMDFVAYDGTLATVIVNSGNGIEFKPDSFTISSPISNSDGVFVFIEGAEFFIPPGARNQIVKIDIMPVGRPYDLDQNKKGSVPVVIFGSAYLDVRSIEVNSLVLEAPAVKMACHSNKVAIIDHVDDDEYPDLVVGFENHNGFLPDGPGYATLKGNLTNGTTISGKDDISAAD